MFIKRLPIEFEMEYAVSNPDLYLFWFDNFEKRQIKGYLSVNRTIWTQDVTNINALEYNGQFYCLLSEDGMIGDNMFVAMSVDEIEQVLNTPDFDTTRGLAKYTFNLSPNK